MLSRVFSAHVLKIACNWLLRPNWPHLAAICAQTTAEKLENFRQTNPELPPKIAVTETILKNPFFCNCNFENFRNFRLSVTVIGKFR